jgi:LytS/YehU family sensor histidine kinase
MVGAGRLVGMDFYQNSSFWVVVTKLFTNHIHLDIVTYWGVLAGGYAINFYRRLRERELVTSQLETRLVRAELEALKGQLHPHFLFNTLNAISVLIRKQDSEGALRTLVGLSELLRITLDNAGHQTVKLEQELDFLDRYLDIQRVRFSDRLAVSKHIDESALDAHVPNLILQPLVENAVRHGIAARASGGTVDLIVERIGDRLRLEVRDDGAGLPEGFRMKTASGVGLSNGRSRLEQMYPDDSSFEVARLPGGGTRATIEMPLSRTEFDG